MFAIKNVDYVDYRMGAIEFGFKKFIRKDPTLDCNLGRLPILEVDGVRIAQSKTIERFVAKQLGLMGSSPIEEALVDAVCEHQRDVREAYGVVDALPKAGKAEKYKQWFDNDFPALLAKVEAALPKGPGPWLVGAQLTLADVAWFGFLLDYLDGGGWAGEKEAVASALPAVPRIKAAVDAVQATPEVAAYLAKRPKGGMLKIIFG